MGRFIPNENTEIAFSTAKPGSPGTPTISSVTAATTGGTVPSGSHGYRVTAVTAKGESLPSPEVTVTNTGSTNVNTVTWDPVTAASGGYNVYGRTAGGELKIAHVASGTTTYADDGSLTPAGALPHTDQAADIAAPTVANWAAAVRLTHLLMSMNFSATGNAVPTPAFDTLFETSILGTSQATATADFYYDDEDNLAWETLPRATRGYFLISRHGGIPAAGESCEVWPVTVLSRAVANMANNTVVSFTVTMAVPEEPAEDAVVAA
jgi:hypothetical protein